MGESENIGPILFQLLSTKCRRNPPFFRVFFCLLHPLSTQEERRLRCCLSIEINWKLLGLGYHKFGDLSEEEEE